MRRCVRWWIAVLTVTSAVVVLPLLPVLAELAPRHFFLPALVVSGLVTVVLERWRSRRVVSVSMALGLVLVALSSLAASSI